MRGPESEFIAALDVAISLAAALVIGWHCASALWLIGTNRSSDGARLTIARGVLTALDLMVAATLLNTLRLDDWAGIRMFAFVLLLRTVLKRVFEREQTMVAGRIAGSDTRDGPPVGPGC